MKTVNKGTWIALLFAVAAMAGGCSVMAPQPDRSRFFTLTPAADSQTPPAESPNGRDLTLGLGPITIPRYLQRPEVVTRINKTELSVSDNDRWAEPLGDSVASVLAQDLSSDIPGLQITPFPWSQETSIDYSVSVQFLHLERTADRRADIEAVWKIRNGRDHRLVQSGITTTSLPAGNDESSASVALSQGVAEVSSKVAEALKQQSQSEADNSKRKP